MRREIEIDAVALASAAVFHLPGWVLKPDYRCKWCDEPLTQRKTTWVSRAGLACDHTYNPTKRHEVKLTHDRCDLLRDDGRVLCFSARRYEGKLHVYGQFKHDYQPHLLFNRDQVPVTSMDFNPTRPIEKIAKDILAKVLPGCELAWAKQDESLAQDDANKAKARIVVTRLAKACGVPDPTQDERRRNGYSSRHEDWNVYGEAGLHVSSCSPDSVEFMRQFSTDPDTAVEILAILRAAKAKRDRQQKSA